eukprot:TRINITY_DN61505_c0_g1_i1.p1 TRINITY_DN61505_c0_g1~~TRINITY_DN61505_c0_g1_i1.p1  ORF type:complete len:185 (+),score=59.65 TRINITY_DN61505_c0_g1_i1:46-600(+)
MSLCGSCQCCQAAYLVGFFFFSSRRRHTRCREVSWARRCVQETGTWDKFKIIMKSSIGTSPKKESKQEPNPSNSMGALKSQTSMDCICTEGEQSMIIKLKFNMAEGKAFVCSEEEPEAIQKEKIIETTNESVRDGRWKQEEHEKFLECLHKYGRCWKKIQTIIAVSYTHLTLPTILLVQISVVA